MQLKSWKIGSLLPSFLHSAAQFYFCTLLAYIEASPNLVLRSAGQASINMIDFKQDLDTYLKAQTSCILVQNCQRGLIVRVGIGTKGVH